MLAQDMTITREAFLRGLPVALDGAPFVVAGDAIRPVDPRQRWRIVLAAMPPLRLGLLSLPRQHVEIHTVGFSDATRRRFVERFELAFRRAGG